MRRYERDLAHLPNESRSARRRTLRKKVAASSQRPDAPVDSPVLTIFSAPKAFKSHAGMIQENAIRSWLRLKPKPKIILFSNDADTPEVGRRLDVAMVRPVETNTYGTPLVSNMFSQADSLAAGELLAFVNADIILPQSAIEAARLALQWSRRFLLVAQRYDVDVRSPITFDEGWEQHWAVPAIARGKLHSPGAIDWFVYPRGQYGDMPPFAVGRTAYDNWLLWSTVASQIPLIDATAFVSLIHQNHDYSHSKLDTWEGQEAHANRKWIKHWTNYYSIAHANWALESDGQIRRATGWKYRMAGPRQLISHAIRATRPIRSRVRSWRFARRYSG
jgi:hypothetical protein